MAEDGEMRPDKLAYELRRAIEKTPVRGYRVVEEFCDGVVEIGGELDLIAVAKQLLSRLRVEELPHGS